MFSIRWINMYTFNIQVGSREPDITRKTVFFSTEKEKDFIEHRVTDGKESRNSTVSPFEIRVI